MQGSSAAVDPSPVLAMNLSSISCTDHATPETPSPLLPTAPTTPDVTVPWPTSSAGGPVLATALRPLRLSVSEVEANDAVVYGLGFTHRLAARPRGLRRAPEARMPTTTPAAPERVVQPASAWMSAPAIPPPPAFKPVLLSPHRSEEHTSELQSP